MNVSAEGRTLDQAIAGALWGVAPFGLAVLDHDLRFLRASSGLAAIDGVPVEQHAGRTLVEVLPAYGPALEVLLRQVRDTGQPALVKQVAVVQSASPEDDPPPPLGCTAVVPVSIEAPVLLLATTGPNGDITASERLEQSQALLNEVQGLAGLGSWTWDILRNVVTWSDEVYRLFGTTKEEFPGTLAGYQARLPPDERDRVTAIVNNTLRTGVPYHFEHRIVRSDGDVRIFECRGKVDRDERGRPIRLAGTVLDITDRKRAEARIREQQEFVNAILENIPNMIFVKDARELKFVRFNRAGEELLGYSRDQLIGKNDYDIFPPAEAAHFQAQDRQVLSGRKVLVCPEDTIHTREHGVRILQSKKVPVFNASGEPAWLLGISEDVTERKRAESFRLSDLLVRSIEDYAVFLLDPKGCVKSWNAGAQRMTGYAEAEVLEHPVDLLRVPGGSPAIESLLARAAEQGHAVEEGPWVCKDGRQLWRITEVTPIRDENGVPVLFGTVTRDITRRKQAERERESLLARLQEAVRYRDEFLSVASHELRTPVATLKLQTEHLAALQKQSPQDAADALPPMLDRFQRQVLRLEKLVGQLLDVTRLSTGREALKVVEAELGEIARTVVMRMQEETRGTPPIRLSVQPGIFGQWDVLRVDQVLTNLLSNAIKYGLGRPIDVVVEREDHEARISVRDQGIGIAPADQARIFGQFERAVSERHYGGLGLGLFIVRQIIEAMDGTVSVESQAGDGACFLVRLPLAREPFGHGD